MAASLIMLTMSCLTGLSQGATAAMTLLLCICLKLHEAMPVGSRLASMADMPFLGTIRICLLACSWRCDSPLSLLGFFQQLATIIVFLLISVAVVAAVIADAAFVSCMTGRITCACAGRESRGSAASALSTGVGSSHPAAAHLKEGPPRGG